MISSRTENLRDKHHHELSTIWPYQLARQRNRLWHVGHGSWTGSDDEESLAARSEPSIWVAIFLILHGPMARGAARSCWVRSFGLTARSDSIRQPRSRKNLQWPSRRGSTLDDCFPPEHIDQYVHSSLENAGPDSFDLVQFHGGRMPGSKTIAGRKRWTNFVVRD